MCRDAILRDAAVDDTSAGSTRWAHVLILPEKKSADGMA
jgi:hypothetical protein